jgi:hypothetical protein
MTRTFVIKRHRFIVSSSLVLTSVFALNFLQLQNIKTTKPPLGHQPEMLSNKSSRTKVINVHRIFNRLQAINRDQSHFKRGLDASERSPFLIKSHVLARKIYKIASRSGQSETVVSEATSGTPRVNRTFGTIVYNRINKSGSATLLSKPRMIAPSC